jgi:membrane-associated phospholipid phosphatase
VTALLLATIVTIMVSAVLPALGAYPTYGFTTNPSGMVGKYADVLSFKSDVQALRSGAMRDLLGPFAGIITFPSYHTIVAVLAAWATWQFRWLGWLNTAASGLVILTTLPIGGHHFVDLIAGGCVACACIAAARKLEGLASVKRQSSVTIRQHGVVVS